MAKSGVNLEWQGGKLIAEIDDICEKAVKKRAEAVARDARGLVPIDTSGLKKSIRVQTWKKPGVFGAYIKAGEVKREHIAIFVELGTPGATSKQGKKRTPIKAAPYMRPALKKNKAKIRRAFENKLK